MLMPEVLRDGTVGCTDCLRATTRPGVHLERTVAGIGEGAVGYLDLEEALAADRDVEVVAGRDSAFCVISRSADGFDAAAMSTPPADGAWSGPARRPGAVVIVRS